MTSRHLTYDFNGFDRVTVDAGLANVAPRALAGIAHSAASLLRKLARASRPFSRCRIRARLAPSTPGVNHAAREMTVAP